MTKDEIKKALECCAKSYGDDVHCSDCPYDTLTPCACYERFCQDVLCKDALKIITEQENEIKNQRQIKEIKNQRQIIENLNGLIDYADKEIRKLKAKNKQAQVDTINTIVEYCENPNHWNELKDCKLWGGKSDDLRNFLNEIFKEVENEN